MAIHRGGRPGERRAAFTLLEVMLATAIGVLLMAAVYTALEVQLRHVQAGRDAVEQNLLARSLLTRMGNDIACHLAPLVPTPTTSSSNSQNNGSSSSTPANSSSSSSSSSKTTPSSSTSSSTASTSSSSTASTSSSSTASTSSSSTMLNSLTGPVTFNLGVQGDNTHLVLYVSRVPREVFLMPSDPTNSNTQQVVSDLRRISYWLAGGGDQPLGLARQEVKVATSDDALLTIPPDGVDEPSSVIAEEIKSLEFSYFDGTNWQTSWDGTTLGSDGVTPIGPPLAIKITIGVAMAGSTSKDLKSHSHVVSIPSANGATPQGQSGSTGTTPQTSTSSQ